MRGAKKQRNYNTREIAIPPDDGRPEWLDGLLSDAKIAGVVIGLLGAFYAFAWVYGHFRWGW